MDASKDPVFICGNDRSGTTMLRLIVDRGDIAIPTPSFLLMDFKAVHHGTRDLTDHAQFETFIQEVWEHPKVQLWDLDGEPPGAPVGLNQDNAYRFAVTSVFEAFAAQAGESRWGDKTAPYVYQIDEILSVWPEARIINLVRDGRDVALSVMPLPFGPNTVLAAADLWVRGIDAGLRATRRYPDSVLTVRYEDVVSNPGDAVPRICKFVDIEYDESLLRLEENPDGRIDQFQESFHPNVYKPINTGSVAKWKTQMAPRDQELFGFIAGDRLEALGYERGPQGPPPTRPELLRHRTTNGAGRTVNFVKHRLITERGHELKYVMQRKRDNALRKLRSRAAPASMGATVDAEVSAGNPDTAEVVIDLRDRTAGAEAAPDMIDPSDAST